MNFYPLLFLSVGFVSIFLGIYAFLFDTRSSSNRIFFCLGIVIGLWNFFASLTLSATDHEMVWLWYRIGSTFCIPGFPLVLHFVLALTGRLGNKAALSVLYLPACYALYRNWSSFYIFRSLERVGGHWVFIPAYDSVFVYLWLAYAVGVVFASVVIAEVWRRKASSVREKKQGRIIVLSLVLFAAASLSADLLLPVFVTVPAMSPLAFIFPMCGILIAIKRFRLFSITNSVVTRDIIENINTSVTLLDTNYKVVFVNKKTELLLGADKGDILNRDISGVLGGGTIFPDRIRRITASQEEEAVFSRRYKTGTGIIQLQIHSSVIRDEYADPVGVLLTVAEYPGLQTFLTRYKLTGREWEVSQYLIQGRSNRQVSAALSVAERTVKAHVAHIYDKLGINNRIQLINLVRDYGLLPALDIATSGE